MALIQTTPTEAHKSLIHIGTYGVHQRFGSRRPARSTVRRPAGSPVTPISMTASYPAGRPVLNSLLAEGSDYSNCIEEGVNKDRPKQRAALFVGIAQAYRQHK